MYVFMDDHDSWCWGIRGRSYTAAKAYSMASFRTVYIFLCWFIGEKKCNYP